jgi:hypothetical protein
LFSSENLFPVFTTGRKALVFKKNCRLRLFSDRETGSSADKANNVPVSPEKIPPAMAASMASSGRVGAVPPA